MAVFEFTTELPTPRDEVFAWFERPGALVRLFPPFAGSVRREPDRGLEVGSTAVIGMGAPGSLGLGLGSLVGAAGAALHLPSSVKPEVLWHARHTALDRGRSFSDTMESGPLERWDHTHTFEDSRPQHERRGPSVDEPRGTVMRDHVDFELPAVSALPGRLPADWGEAWMRRELHRIFTYRERQLLDDLRFHRQHAGPVRTVAVTGASGMIGTQLCALLAGGGHRVRKLVRRPAHAPDEIEWHPERGPGDPAALAPSALEECDAVVHLAGYPFVGRFSDKHRELIHSSRVHGAAVIARALAELSDGVQRTLVCASGTGYYGAHPHGQGTARTSDPAPLTEDAPVGQDFLAKVCADWEAACRPAAQAGVRVVNLRTGPVLSPAGGLLQRFLPLFVAGVGGPLGGDEWFSWIGIDDIASVHAHAVLDPSVEGPVNAVAPGPVTSRELAHTLGRVLRRPSLVPVPRFGPRLLLGKQGAEELAYADQRVSADKLVESGYTFRHPSLEKALRHVLGRR